MCLQCIIQVRQVHVHVNGYHTLCSNNAPSSYELKYVSKGTKNDSSLQKCMNASGKNEHISF